MLTDYNYLWLAQLRWQGSILRQITAKAVSQLLLTPPAMQLAQFLLYSGTGNNATDCGVKHMTVSGLSINNYQLQYQLLKPATEAADNNSQRQEIAAITTTVATPATQQALQQDETSKQQEAFLSQLMDQMLANRIGLDKQKYDEIKAEMEEAQAEKEMLQQQPQSSDRDSKIAVLDAKLEKLGKALEGLIEQANRNRENSEREKQSSNAVQLYQLTATTEKQPRLFL